MNNDYSLTIKIPSGDEPLIEYGRHFNVQGRIIHKDDLPEDAVLNVSLIDEAGRVIRYARQTRKNNVNVYLSHPQLTCYSEDIDPQRKGIVEFGFPELMVIDLSKPYESLKDATIKCFYSDDEYKAVIVTATDRDHGMVFDDGMGYTDENGCPYEVIPCGNYDITVELETADGRLLAKTGKHIVISHRSTQTIVRFNPSSHKKNMVKWCSEQGFNICEDTLPGYLEPYKGVWYYHMGLLPMYRACDIAFYQDVKVYMFVYLIDPTSTSYETELAYLQTIRAVGDPDRFAAFHYDIGEAILDKCENGTKQGRIMEFEEGEYLYIYRVDIVNDKALENVYDLSGEDVISSMTDTSKLTVPAGSRIAITGVVRPWQLAPSSFELTKENVYICKDCVNELHYEIDDGSTIYTEVRKLMLERFVDAPSSDASSKTIPVENKSKDRCMIGSSVFEFYNIFEIPVSLTGKSIDYTVIACDNSGEKKDAYAKLRVDVT